MSKLLLGTGHHLQNLIGIFRGTDLASFSISIKKNALRKKTTSLLNHIDNGVTRDPARPFHISLRIQLTVLSDINATTLIRCSILDQCKPTKTFIFILLQVKLMFVEVPYLNSSFT